MTVPATAQQNETLPAASKLMTIQGYLNSDKVKQYLEGVLKERAGQFITSLVSLSNLSPHLAACEPKSLMMCGLKAASLNLPLDNNIGFAYAVPYKDNRRGVTECQFQIGYKGFIQLAMRTGLYRSINVIDIREGELTLWNALSETLTLEMIDDAATRDKAPILGYAAMFELSNGFKKVIYKRKDTLVAHGKRFSKAYSSGPWQSDTDSMCRKTLIKELLSKWGPLTTEIIESVKYDQSVIRETATGDTHPEYIDSEEEITPEAAITYDIPADILEDINMITGILGISEADKAMRLGACKGDLAAVTAYRDELKVLLGQKEAKDQGGAELFGEDAKKGGKK